MRDCRNNRDATLTNDTTLEATVRPIGEVMPLVLARYGAGPYRFHWCGDGLTRGNDTEQTDDIQSSSALAMMTR